MQDMDMLRFDRTLTIEKRIETGSFYTPPEMAKFMIFLSLSCLLEDRLGKHSKEEYYSILTAVDSPKDRTISSEDTAEINEVLAGLTVLDLAAGSGIFPLMYMQVLQQWFENANALSKWKPNEAAKRLYVIDIQPEPLALFKSEMLKSYPVKSSDLSVFCLDALSDEAIRQHRKLKCVMDGGFDLILGNPPYLGEKNHKSLFQSLRATPFGSKYYEGRMDYFYYFIYRGLECLKPGGQLCYITTNYFATADGAKALRQFLKGNGQFKALVNYNDCALFKDALGQHNVVFVYQKQGTSEDKTCLLAYPSNKLVQMEKLHAGISAGVSNEEWIIQELDEDAVYDYQGMIKMIPNEAHQPLLNKLRIANGLLRKTLGETFYVQQGIVSGFDRDFKADQGVFILTDDEAKSRPLLSDYLKPFYKNKQIRKYRIVKPTRYQILYLSEKMEQMEREEGPLFEHLAPHKVRLASRREVVKNIRPWYALQWPREPWRFEGPLIAAPQRAFVNVFSFEKNELYGSADIYYISDRFKDEETLEKTLWMTAYLNSPLVYFWLSLMGKRKGSMLELYATPLKSIPIVEFDKTNPIHLEVIKSVTVLLEQPQNEMDLVKHKENLHRIHQLLYGIFELSPTEISHLHQYYEESGAAAYEESYWNLDFAQG